MQSTTNRWPARRRHRSADTEQLRRLMLEELALAGIHRGDKVAGSKIGAVLCRASRRMLSERGLGSDDREKRPVS